MTEVPIDTLNVPQHLFTGDEDVPEGTETAREMTAYTKKHLVAAFDALVEMDRGGTFKALKFDDFDKFCQRIFGFNGAAVRMVRTHQVNDALAEAGLKRVSPRIALLIYDLPIQQQIEVMTLAIQMAQKTRRSGKAAHWNGKVTAPIVEAARKKMAPDAYRPKNWVAPVEKPQKPANTGPLQATRVGMDIEYRHMIIDAIGMDGKPIAVRVDPRTIKQALPEGF